MTTPSDALLAGKIFDDRGNRMSPSHATKAGRRWRYYVSQAPLQGRKRDAGSLARASAAEIEKLVMEAISSCLLTSGRSIVTSTGRAQTSAEAKTPGETVGERPDANDHARDLREAIERVTIGRTTITIVLSDDVAAEGRDQTLTVRWTPPSPTRRREIIQGEGDQNPSIRPMRVKARVGLVEALRNAHRWLDELLDEPQQNIEAIAAREGNTERSIRMTLSLGFLAPAIVKAAIEGRLPRGFGVTRLIDPPMAWSDQWAALGLTAPAAN